MHVAVEALDRFYYSSPLGALTRRSIQRAMAELWGTAHALDVVGVGYAVPFLRPLLADSASIAAFMPGQQGVMRWPKDRPNVVSLVDESCLPLPDCSVDRLLVAHAVETSGNLAALLDECWRVLRPAGRIAVLAPNRVGLWAWVEATPFGQGRPFSRSQLMRLLESHHFTPSRSRYAMFTPPINRTAILRVSQAFETVGRRLWRHNAGLVLVEAEKLVMARPARAKRVRERQTLPGLAPQPAGAVPAPVEARRQQRS